MELFSYLKHKFKLNSLDPLQENKIQLLLKQQKKIEQDFYNYFVCWKENMEMITAQFALCSCVVYCFLVFFYCTNKCFSQRKLKLINMFTNMEAVKFIYLWSYSHSEVVKGAKCKRAIGSDKFYLL